MEIYITSCVVIYFLIKQMFFTPDSPDADSPDDDFPAANSPAADSPAADSPAADSPAADSPAPDSPAANSEDESRTKWSTNSTTDSCNTRTEVKGTSLLQNASGEQEDVNAASSSRKSAFKPYRPIGKVLTNLQRGNTEATFFPTEVRLSFHERAGQGELTAEQIRSEYSKLNVNKKQNDLRDGNGFTPLHWSAYYGQLNVVQLLLDMAHVAVDTQAPEMVTPLLLAACAGHHEVVRLLLERGADPVHMDINGNTALIYAAAGNHPHTCYELINKHNDITLTNVNGDTAYSIAVELGATLAKDVIEQFLMSILPF